MTRVLAPVLASLLFSVGDAAVPADFEIKSLPGLKEELGFKQYAGLMPIGLSSYT
jgi:hypothetical protein